MGPFRELADIDVLAPGGSGSVVGSGALDVLGLSVQVSILASELWHCALDGSLRGRVYRGVAMVNTLSLCTMV